MSGFITSCDIVPDPEMDYKLMPKSFYDALNTVLGVLKGYGINDRINASLKQFSGNERCWLAMYMRQSQFRGDPQFYVNTQTPGIIDAAVLPQHVTVEDVFEDSLYHEYGHVILEFAESRNEEMYNLVYGPFSDEEDFAEYCVDFFRYHKDRSGRKDVVEKVIYLYVKEVF